MTLVPFSLSSVGQSVLSRLSDIEYADGVFGTRLDGVERGTIVTVEQYGGGIDKTAPVNTAAILAAASAGVAELNFRAGVYLLDPFTISAANNFTMVGVGAFSKGTTFRFSSTTGDDITFTASQAVGVKKIWFYPVVRKTSGYAIKFATGSFNPTIESCRFDYCWNGIYIAIATEARILKNVFRYMLGSRGIQIGGVGGTVYRAVLDDNIGDNPYPVTIASRISWAASTAVALGQIINANGSIWQCVTAGTTGSASPNVIPGSGSSAAFSSNFVDGTAQWRFVCNNDLRWIVQDSFAYSIVINKAALLNGMVGYTMQDSAATGSSFPVWCFGWDIEADHSYSLGAQLLGGEGVYLNGSWFGSSLTGNAITIGPSHRGEIQIGSGTRIMGNWQHGILCQAGPKDVTISNCFIGANSQAGSANFHGIVIAAAASEFTITNNKSGSLPSGTNLQGYGILINAGASDHYVVTGNRLSGNVTGTVFDGGAGTNKSVTGNVA